MNTLARYPRLWIFFAETGRFIELDHLLLARGEGAKCKLFLPPSFSAVLLADKDISRRSSVMSAVLRGMAKRGLSLLTERRSALNACHPLNLNLRLTHNIFMR